MSSAARLPPADYEPRDASPTVIAGVGLGLAAGLVLVLWVCARMMGPGTGQTATEADRRQTSFHSGAEATTGIDADWQRLDAETQRNLETYGWVDRERGVVRIPIDRAMDLLVKEAAPKAKEGAR
jgi:hypothetical protein